MISHQNVECHDHKGSEKIARRLLISLRRGAGPSTRSACVEANAIRTLSCNVMLEIEPFSRSGPDKPDLVWSTVVKANNSLPSL